MNSEVVRSLVQSGDDDASELVLLRLVRQSKLAEADEALLRERIPTLSLRHLADLVARHGVLGCQAEVLKRLAVEMPRDHASQLGYVSYLLEFLPRALGDEAYADFVERVSPAALELPRRMLCASLRRGEVFNAVAKHDGAGPRWANLGANAPLALRLLDVPYDGAAILARLGEWIAQSPLAELLRLRWLTAEMGHLDLAEAAWQRCLALFPLPRAVEETDADRELRGHHWTLVVAWVNEASPGRGDRLAWLADRLALDEDFSPWPGFPQNLRDDVAGLLLDRGHVPEWVGPTLHRRLAGGSLEAWRLVFAWWCPDDPARRIGCGYFFRHYQTCKAVLMDAPLPAEAEQDFDQAFLRCGADLMTYEREQIEGHRRMLGLGQVPDHGFDFESTPAFSLATARFHPQVTVPKLVDRLLQMPLTRSRAAGIARMIKGHRELIADPRMLEVAAVSGAIAPEELPALEEIQLHEVNQATLYRRLGGAVADQRLREHFRGLLAETRAPGGKESGGFHFPWFWSLLAEVVDDDLRAELTDWIATAPLREVVNLYGTLPWLVVGEPVLVAAAQRHLDAGLGWDFFELSPVLRPFIEKRARRTEDDVELARLLEWLDGQGASREQQLAIVLARLEGRPPTPHLADAVARMLDSRAAWENDGAVVLRAFVRWRDWGGVTRLLTGGPRGLGWMTDTADRLEKQLKAVHLVFAQVLLELAGAASVAADEEGVLAALAAVLQLDPPPPIVRELARLKQRGDLSDRAVERIDAGMKLFKSMAGRAPSLQALYEAMATLRAAEESRSLRTRDPR